MTGEQPKRKHSRFLILKKSLTASLSWALFTALALTPLARAQSTGQSQGQSAGQAPAKQGPAQDIPDAPSTVQPPPPKPAPQPEPPPPSEPMPDSSSGPDAQAPQDQEKAAPPPMPPVETVPPGSMPEASQQPGEPRNQINSKEPLYRIVVSTNFVQIPVMVKDDRGRRVDGLLPTDFTVKENGKPQTLAYFTSDPYPLSVAIVLDNGMADVAWQKVNQTYSSLVGAFSPYDEVAVYTYSSTVSQLSDFTARPEKLTASLDTLKLVRGHNNGPPVLGGPLGPQGPTVNGIPVGTSGPPPVYTPPREAHVLNDAILRAALDLSKRGRTRRKVIFVISDGRELGSRASYSEVLKLLETRDIQVKAVVVDNGALPLFKQVDKIHLPKQGYSNILPKYTSATGGGSVYSELSRNAMEEAYAQITSEARNQYTLGYIPKATGGSSAYHSIEVIVHRKGLRVSARDGYYPAPVAR